MADLWSTLGYDRISKRIAESLRESRDLLVIEGPPGVGKSWLGQGIGLLWSEGGGTALLAQGDSFRSFSSMHPFGFAMQPLVGGLRTLGPVIATISKAGETLLLGTAGIITSTVSS